MADHQQITTPTNHLEDVFDCSPNHQGIDTSPSALNSDSSEPTGSSSQAAGESNFKVQESMAQAMSYYSRLEALLGQLENRVGDIDRRIQINPPPNEVNKIDDSGAKVGKIEPDTDSNKPIPPAPKIKECDWEHFVNRFHPEDGSSLVDVLVAGHQLGKDVANELERREGSISSSVYTIQSMVLSTRTVHRIETHSRWIQRVRIQSKPLLDIFSRVTNYTWGTKPHTFVRPFQYLLHFHDKFKEELYRLESQSQSASKMTESESGSKGTIQEESTTSAALHDLRCYIDFAEEKLLPPYESYNGGSFSSSPSRKRIRFDDLWYLFRPGDLIYIPSKTLTKATLYELDSFRSNPGRGSTHQSWLQQKIWRLYFRQPPEAEVSPSVDGQSRSNKFCAHCYYLDFDGTTYGAVGLSFCIEYYEGEKDIAELDFYPLRFFHNVDELLKVHRDQGSQFVKWASQSHAIYDGWNFVTDPAGIPVVDGERDFGLKLTQERTRHIEGEVIIDFQEAINSRPDYKPKFVTDGELFNNWQSMSRTVDGIYGIIQWSDSHRSKLLSVSWEATVTDDDCNALEANNFIETDRYLIENNRTGHPPEGDDVVLLSPRVFVYAFRQRKFFPIDCRRLSAISVQKDAFQQLQLPEDHKRMIQAAIHSHTRKFRIERRITATSGKQIQTQDFIAGKGRGLLILLHGEPGIGKTATAEAVAQSTKKPLFSISCGDLGDRFRMEEQLDQIFRLAHIWECVLLMDEADVFLSARGTNNEINPLVSIFLRRLEYYNGILFLTTNRIGKLDPALGSRIHLTFHYKRFGLQATENVFRINMERLQQAELQQSEISREPPLFIMEQDVLRFASDHYGKHPKGKGAWNGRQIRNAFTIAASLARHEAEQPGLVGTGFQPQLRYSHFQAVERLTEEHDRFRAHVLGGDDSRKARLNEERDDDYEGYEEEEQVSNIVGQLKLARLFYMNQQASPYPREGNLGTGLSGYTQPPLPGQPVVLGHAQSHMNHAQQQFAISQEARPPNFAAHSQAQGQYIVPQQNNPPRPFGVARSPPPIQSTSQTPSQFTDQPLVGP